MTEPEEKLPKVVVAALIEQDGKYLLTKELTESGKEKWLIPGGKVRFGESLEQALKREIKEEVSLDIEIQKLFTWKEVIFPNFNYHSIVFFYLTKPIKGRRSWKDSLDTSKESVILDAQFFSPEDAQKLPLVDSARQIFEQLTTYLKKRKPPNSAAHYFPGE